MAKVRIDALLVSRGLVDSREQAQRLILAGEVSSRGHAVAKPGTKIADDTPLEVKNKPKYVGRGGFKLEGALDFFGVDPVGKVCLDIGASTGGFTDCLLQRGALRVHAIDVGTNQLVWKLRNDSRVIVKEQFNARHMVESDLGESVELIVSDVSFISLTKILPAAFGVLQPEGQIVCLIKPQFELTPECIGTGGIVRDEALRQQAIDKIHDFVVNELHRTWLGCAPSQITGTDGNQEFLAWLR